ncbi:hypothetical protein AYO45_06715 [Gammaproteobacteria bacterium SCGC AG-212-F23]|nr:hypothetical protein AYO45_06715 [Gammaproteobacteria bacterium SCGC AG-212-F23]
MKKVIAIIAAAAIMVSSAAMAKCHCKHKCHKKSAQSTSQPAANKDAAKPADGATADQAMPAQK